MTNGAYPAEIEKAYNAEAERRSVVDHPSDSLPASLSSIVWPMFNAINTLPEWGTSPVSRDAQLRALITQESIFAGALGTVCARNAAFSWVLTGPRSQVERISKIMDEADFGAGWESLIIKLSIDLYTQDKGAFLEIVRAGDSATSELVGLNPLDAAKCHPTGDPEVPVIYQDRLGRWHYLKWFQVVSIKEMPSSIEGVYGLQYCALSRLLNRLQILRNIAIYDDEKTGGRFTRAIQLLKGVSARQVQTAINDASILNDQQGLRRFSTPVMVSSVSPDADIGHDTIELASMPDNFSREDVMKWYIAEVALAFGEDYQTFSPLPGGNLGTSSQSQVLSAKARGRGPGLFMKLMTHALNFNAMPKSVAFAYDEQDLQEELDEANVKLKRAQERAIRIKSGEISIPVAQTLAKDAGDLSQELLEAMSAEDLTPDVSVNDGSSAESQIGSEGQTNGAPGRAAPDRTTNLTRAPAGANNSSPLTTKELRQGVMLALYPQKSVANKIAIPNKEEASELHITLLYFGKVDALDDAVISTVRAVASSLSSFQAPIKGLLSGLGRFYTTDSDGNQAFYASLDSPEVTDLRNKLAEQLSGLFSTDHGFTPHMTLAYVKPDEANPIDLWTPEPVTFNGLHLVVAGEDEIFPFIG